ncbi:UNVERIFIED_CONTAM: hypothetical protein PYX00_010770 [Menopon gallinae]|uniref:Neuronal membrane glycoprotein M6-b n=1 Tax=Menopon gallinae TaxID=328185 RepID=A0AAW2HGR6_9NEOP
MDPASIPLKKNQNTASHESFSRFSEKSIHSTYASKEGRKNTCSRCLTRIPYATLFATVMCLVWVGVFCGTMHRGATLTVLMLDRVFHIRAEWVEIIQLVFTSVGAGMTAIGLMILFVGFLATGATRQKVYHTWRARAGGRISCVVFMIISYVLLILWMLILCFLVIITLLTTLSWFLCDSHRVLEEHQCIDFSQFDFMFPNTTQVQQHLKICEPNDIKLFCKDFVEKAEVVFIAAAIASFVVVLSLVHYLMCLSANYAHIRDQSKFQELQELKYLSAETEVLDTSKDRF